MVVVTIVHLLKEVETGKEVGEGSRTKVGDEGVLLGPAEGVGEVSLFMADAEGWELSGSTASELNASTEVVASMATNEGGR